MSTYEIKMNTASVSEIRNHLRSCSSLFIPSLDTYVNISDYAKKIRLYAVTMEVWQNKELIALAAIYFNDFKRKRGFLTNISVLRTYQGEGISSLLMQKILDYGKSINFKEIELEVKKRNIKAINLYQRYGFKRYNSTSTSLLMKKIL